MVLSEIYEMINGKHTFLFWEINPQTYAGIYIEEERNKVRQILISVSWRPVTLNEK